MKMNKKGFTLAELLIVIAIIAVLIAIAIPVFSGQLDNAKLQADHANLRSAYAISQTINLIGPSTDNIVGYDADTPTLSATYCTDGQFHATETTAVTMQAPASKHTGKSGTGSCKTCVVDCSKWNSADNMKIVLQAYQTGGTTEATSIANTALWDLKAVS